MHPLILAVLARVLAPLHVGRRESALTPQIGIYHHVATAEHEVDHETLPW